MAGADVRVLRHAPDLQLLIRVHPAEIQRLPTVAAADSAELRKRLPLRSPNIIVVPPESGLQHLRADVALQYRRSSTGPKMGSS
jgi:hypothetical protein